MKANIKKYILAAACLCFLIPVQAFDKSKIEHRIVAGFNLGATAPTSMAKEIRSIDGWWPQFTPQLGYNAIYHLDEKFGVGSGIMLDYKGMGGRITAKYIHTRVQYETDILEGYFVGKNETRIKTAHVTIPLFATYSFNEKWRIRAGGYASYAFSTSFKGKVYDGYLRVNDPTGKKIEFQGDNVATFDFSNDIRDFDFGILAGGEMKVNQMFNIFGNLSWGLRPIFSKEKRVMDFNMYNIYFTLGLAYHL